MIDFETACCNTKAAVRELDDSARARSSNPERYLDAQKAATIAIAQLTVAFRREVSRIDLASRTDSHAERTPPGAGIVGPEDRHARL